MSIPKKGARTITVDEISYRWAIRKAPTYTQANNWSNMTVAIELMDNPGATLIVNLPIARPDAWINPSNVSITPSQVARYIREAHRQGWVPSKHGSTFHLQIMDTNLSLS